jgi:hypothetical protein
VLPAQITQVGAMVFKAAPIRDGHGKLVESLQVADPMSVCFVIGPTQNRIQQGPEEDGCTQPSTGAIHGFSQREQPAIKVPVELAGVVQQIGFGRIQTPHFGKENCRGVGS